MTIVGARNASANGRRIACDIAAELAKNDLVVVSGMARGVDVPYPNEVAELHQEMVACGVVLSEMPVGTVPQGRHFPHRNRIISELSLGGVVIEAATCSARSSRCSGCRWPSARPSACWP